MPIPFIKVEPVEQLLEWEEGVVEAPEVTVAVLLAVEELVAPADRLAVWSDDFVAEGVSNVAPPPPPPPEVVVVKLLSGFSTVSEVTVAEDDVKAVIVVPSQMRGTPFT